MLRFFRWCFLFWFFISLDVQNYFVVLRMYYSKSFLIVKYKSFFKYFGKIFYCVSSYCHYVSHFKEFLIPFLVDLIKYALQTFLLENLLNRFLKTVVFMWKLMKLSSIPSFIPKSILYSSWKYVQVWNLK